MEQVARALNSLCRSWLDNRHARKHRRDRAQRLSHIVTYHQHRNLAAKNSRLRRYQEAEGAL
jgi:hypothetical protein